MKNYKYKILVLSDLKNTADTMLKSTISLAKMIDGEIDFLCVKKPSEIVKKENQLSAMRVINEEHFTAKKEILNLIKPVSEAYSIKINHTLSYGNVKSEIGKYIKEHQPDIIVLGKRKSKGFNLLGDNITQFVLNNHAGTIMISTNKNALEPDKKLSLGILNDIKETSNLEFTKNLLENTHKPLKSFKLVKNSNEKNQVSLNDMETVEYVFEENDNAIKNISNYLSKSNINLLCIDRENEKNKNSKHVLKSDINNLINNFNVSLLLTNGHQLKLK
ncbi:Nucleotide-binding universal stress protein, UspA family [Flaviramulus basaltis]|uniref:Nucleotide-binding universal stress protein, UspA family n=1 Tax=Flaviramulus basaltis TaxID=369401 RepID=A0A1K2IDV7_9FLAO|nr:universal stress protein [Flaviramulus basaltis]SFZ90450.1 Nucleotide-binding universal stress protein, UspA family [Flaviramulus basaltis]